MQHQGRKLKIYYEYLPNQEKPLQYKQSIFKQYWIVYQYIIEHFETYSSLDFIYKANRLHTQFQFQLLNKLELPSQLRKRLYTQQGFGNKKVFQYEWQKGNAKEFPSPDRYKKRQELGVDQLKRSFGLQWETYSMIYLPYNKHQAPEVAEFQPGSFPDEQLISWRILCALRSWSTQIQVLIKGKGKMFNDQREDGFPGHENYQPQISLIVPNRFQGIGEKKNPFQSLSFTLGLRRYKQNSRFDKVFKKREFITKPGERRPFI